MSSRRRLLALGPYGLRWLAFGLLAGALACSPGPQRDLVLITVDTLRADHVGLYGYARDTTPELDAFFADGLVYERSYAAEASTPPSVVSLLSGRLPQEHRVRLFYQPLPPGIELLPDALPWRYRTAAFVSNTVLSEEALGIADRFDHYDDTLERRESSRRVWEREARATTDAALAWLAREGGDAPLFLWLHYIDPHGPYAPPDDWPHRFDHEEPLPIDPARVPGYIAVPGESDARAYIDAYDDEIAYTDHHVARFLRDYAEHRPIEEALVVFTADHGESLLEHEKWFTHGYHVYDEVVRVPLMLRGPGVPEGRSRRLTSGVDLFETLLAFARGQPPVPGRADLRNPDSLPAGRVVYSEGSFSRRQRRAAVSGETKWVLQVSQATGRVLSRVRYDLARDPGETEGASWGGRDAVGARLLALAGADPDPAGAPAREGEAGAAGAQKVAPGVSEEARERLRALGYVESSE